MKYREFTKQLGETQQGKPQGHFALKHPIWTARALWRGEFNLTSAAAMAPREDPLALFMKAWDASPLPFFVLNCERNVRMANKAFGAIFGIRESQYEGMQLANVITEKKENQTALKARDMSHAKKEDVIITEVEITNQTTIARHTIQLVEIKVADNEGTPIYVGIGVDLTERTILLRRMAEFKSIVENSPDAIVMVNAKGTITRWNPAAEKIFGFAKQDAIGKEMVELLSLNEGFVAQLEAAKSAAVDHEMRFFGKDGADTPLYCICTPIKNSEGELERILVMARDMTEHEQATKLATEKALRERAEMIIRTLNHKLNSKFCAIRLVTDVVRRTLGREFAIVSLPAVKALENALAGGDIAALNELVATLRKSLNGQNVVMSQKFLDIIDQSEREATQTVAELMNAPGLEIQPYVGDQKLVEPAKQD